MKIFSHFLATVSTLSMVITPVAHGAQAKKISQREKVATYLKEMGLAGKKPKTVKEFWRSVRHVYPKDIQQKMDQWVARNHNELMPVFEATTFKDGAGKEQVRLLIKKDKQTLTATITGDEDIPLKIGGVSFTKKEITKPNSVLNKYYQQDAGFRKQFNNSQNRQSLLRKNPVISYQDFIKLTDAQRIEYIIYARKTMEAAQKVLESKERKSVRIEQDAKSYAEVLWNNLLGSEAIASLGGKRCVVAGYISVYGGSTQSCGGAAEGQADLKQQMDRYKASCPDSGAVPCNPLVYGFKAGSEAYCVPRSNVKYATSYCNKQSPLNDVSDKKRIIESFYERDGKKIDLKFNEEGKISKEQYAEISEYLKGLNGLISGAVELCDKDPEFAAIKAKRDDQVDACESLKIRAFDLQTLEVATEEGAVLPVPVGGDSDCKLTKPGSNYDEEQKKCVCAEGQEEQKNNEGKSACVVVGGLDLPAETGIEEGAVPPAEEASWWDRNKDWVVPVGIFAGLLGLLWWLNKDDKKQSAVAHVPQPTPPLPDCPPGYKKDANGACTRTIRQVVKVPVTAPAPPPIQCSGQIVNNVCIPPVVTPPPSEGGSGTTPPPGSAGGVLDRGAR
ncbi:MAG: hypothetical protein ACLGGX_11145 [Bdellovibrionia bacterium]